MAIKIDFDAAHNPQSPTIILAKKNGDKLGRIDAVEIESTDSMNDASEISFKVYKTVDENKNKLWDEIVNFRLIYCLEWNQWFEITVETDEDTKTVKTVTGTNLGCAELSQIMLYNVEINTEDDIAREDYDKDHPTIFYNPDRPSSSLLHRMLEKAPHYTIGHVDATIANIQRTFSFDDKSIYDGFQDVAEEIKCLFVFDINADKYGNLKRVVSAYDLESNCHKCGHRGEYTDVCPKCGSTDIDEGYGEDTTIFVTADEIADNINMSSDTDSIKNCFKLEGGDDLMTATIRNCNPNGSDYIWYISDDTKHDMSDELVKAIDSYNKIYAEYQNDYVYLADKEDIVTKYNELIVKYGTKSIYLKSSEDERLFSSKNEHLAIKKEVGYNNDIQEIELPVKGYPALMNAYYNTIDLGLYLTSGLMPIVEMSDTNAEKEAAKLTAANLSPVAVEKIDNISVATADSVVLSMAKVVVDSTRYRVKVHDGSTLSGTKPDPTRVWTGCFDVTNYSDEEDKFTSKEISVTINSDYEKFIKQKIDKTLAKEDSENKYGISELFDIDGSLDDFKKELQKYCLNRLISFHDACQSCIDILVEQGVNEGSSWSKELYDKLYTPYIDRMNAIEKEMKTRQDEIYLISGRRDDDGDLKEYGLQNYIIEEKDKTQDILNFQQYLTNYNAGGANLWLEFCSFRREDKYSNENYISDGLNNAELFKKANEFISVANDEIYKSSELQTTISADLKNLLLISKFAPLVNDFAIGNWLRVMVDDKLYKLRLIEYTVDYDDLDNISVEFSDAVRVKSSVKSIKGVIDQASSMATSYSYVQKQAKQGEKGTTVVNNWLDNGLDVTHTKIVGGSDNQTQSWDNHGMLFRKFDEVSNDYEPTQMKIINSTIAITDDNWATTKTAIGKYYYTDPDTGDTVSAYGINGETIIGKLFLGKNIELKNDAGTLVFNDNGLEVSHGTNRVSISPKNNNVIDITNGDESVFNVNDKGELYISGNIMARSLELDTGVKIDSGVIVNLAKIATSGSYTDLIGDNAKNGQVLSLDDKDKVVAKQLTCSDISDLASVAKSGSYNDLKDKPLLKPVATSGKYTDLTGDGSEAGKLLYVDTDGSVTTITIDRLKELLGI